MPSRRIFLKTFELGLVMAGAVSAGAYSAGVMDYMIEALETWEKARESGKSIPDHRTLIKVLAGASAGGMVASLTAAAFIDPNHRPIQGPVQGNTATQNRLYDAWVRGVDMLDLLKDNDLTDPEMEIMAILNNNAIPSVAHRHLQLENPKPLPAYIDPNIQIYLTTANMRGVTYDLHMNTNSSDHEYEMLRHADYSHFYMGTQNDFLDDLGAEHLDYNNLSSFTNEYWVHSSIATGGFPIAFAPTPIRTKKRHYQDRRWRAQLDRPNVDGRCYSFKRISPTWQDNSPDFNFTAIDGGLFDNHPLDYARRVLTRAESANPVAFKSDSSESESALLMLDPFPPCAPPKDYQPSKNLLELTMRMAASQRTNAHFKADELIRAQDPSNGNVFMISPKRDKQPFLASGGMSGFGGFMEETFRAHDYHLGRRNCQNFLRQYLVLKADNPLFDSWRENRDLYETYKVTLHGSDHLPIIPLLPELREEIPLQPWPLFTEAKYETIRKHLNKRSKDLMTHLLNQKVKNRLLRWPIKNLYNYVVSPLLANYVADLIKDNLKDQVDF